MEFVSGVRIGLRRLRSHPAFTLLAVSSLAFGIAASTAIYSVINAQLLRALPIRDIDQVVNIYHSNPEEAPILIHLPLSWPDYQDLRTRQTTFSSVIGWTRFRASISGGGTGQVVLGEAVSGEYFDLIGAQPVLGRTVQSADDHPNAPRVVVLSHGLWTRMFGSDPQIVGRAVKIDGHTFGIIGVAAESFRGVDMPKVSPTAAWVPLSTVAVLGSAVPRSTFDVTLRGRRWIFVKARLAPGRTLADASNEVRTIATSLDASDPIGAEFPKHYQLATAFLKREWHVMPAAKLRNHETVDPVAVPLALTLLAASMLVLLVACSNVANLIIARGAQRQREVAMCLALGATRWRVISQQLLESGLLAVIGTALGLLFAKLLTDYVSSLALRAGPGLTVQMDVRPDLTVLVAGAFAGVLCLLVCGLWPAIVTTRATTRSALAGEGLLGKLDRRRGQQNLIAAQVAVSVVLFLIAALCSQQIMSEAQKQSGLLLHQLALSQTDFKMQARGESRARQLVVDILRQLDEHPAVDSAAVSTGLPAGLSAPFGAVRAPGAQSSSGAGKPARLLSITEGFMSTVGLQLLRGRTFDSRDRVDAMPVAVISDSVAAELFLGREALGQQVVVQYNPRRGERSSEPQTLTVVGVAADIQSPSGPPELLVYRPFSQHFDPAITFLVRSENPARSVGLLQEVIRRADPELPIVDAGTGSRLASPASGALQSLAAIAAILAALALVLAMSGLYGVLSQSVARRTKEIGIRLAVGASPRQIVRMLVTEGTRPVIEGLSVGLAVGVIARLALKPVFVRFVPAADPVLLLWVPMPFVIVGLATCYSIARRAAGTTPASVLRES